MHCSTCGRENSAFAVRCRSCGEPLSRRVTAVPPVPRARWPGLAIACAAIGCASTVALIALVALVSQQNLWPRLLGSGSAEQSSAAVSSSAAPTTAPLVARPVALPSSALPSALGRGNASGDWEAVVDQVAVAPDDTLNGWLQVLVTFTFQNTSHAANALNIPATVADNGAAAVKPRDVPNFQPMQAIPENAPSVVNGLRLYLLDNGRREFGGGFGGTFGSYDLIEAPGDLVQLTYRFRVPSDVGAPSVLRMVFPDSGGGRVYEVHLDRREPAAGLSLASDVPRAPVGSQVVVGDTWGIRVDGADFGPSSGPGERPVTVHLQIENRSGTDQTALTDPADPRGALRDFYLTDSSGHLAYSHMDDMPGVIVPAHASRSVTVKLYTLDLSSSSHPLYFTAVLNWKTNHYARFQLT